jgi:hypothetical protein
MRLVTSLADNGYAGRSFGSTSENTAAAHAKPTMPTRSTAGEIRSDFDRGLLGYNRNPVCAVAMSEA